MRTCSIAPAFDVEKRRSKSRAEPHCVLVTVLASEKAVEPLEGGWHVGATVTEPKVVARVSELRGWKEKYTFSLDELGRERVDTPISQSRKADAAGDGTGPVEPIGVPREEIVEQREIGIDDCPGAIDETRAGAQPDECKDFAWRRVADRRVVLERGDAFADRRVATRQPANANAGEAERLGHHAETHRAIGAFGGGRKSRRAMLEKTIDLVR